MIIRTATEIGHLVRDARKRRSLTQAQLAEEVGVSRKWIIDLEGGKRTADLTLVLRTLNALRLEVDVEARRPGKPRHGAIDIDAIVAAARKPRK